MPRGGRAAAPTRRELALRFLSQGDSFACSQGHCLHSICPERKNFQIRARPYSDNVF